jgi:CBS domain containing-hemolysin-like protein
MPSDKGDPVSPAKIMDRLGSIINNRFKKKHGKYFDYRELEKLDIPRMEMIRGIFELSENNARDIMIPRVDIAAVDSKTELKPLVKLIWEAGHSRVPVYEDTIDNISGILYVKDLLKLIIDMPKKFRLSKILHTPYFVPETMPLAELMLEFQKRKLHQAIVVDEYGGVSGLVTLEDILEEIVGEINDEFDEVELPEIEKTGKNIYEIDPRLTISDFNEATGSNLPTDNFDTIGGFVLDLFGKIPAKNDSARHEKITFKIKDITGTVINRITATILKIK